MSITSEKTKEEEEESYLEYPKNEEGEDESGSNFEFLKELTKNNYVEKKELTEKEVNKIKNEEKRQLHLFLQEQHREEKRQIRMNKEEDLRQKKEMKNKNKNKNQNQHQHQNKIHCDNGEKDEINSLFDENPTILMGRDRLLITKKIQQYKILFPKELSKFKLKKKATLEELKLALDECVALVEINSIDSFILDSILSCIRMCENFTQESEYDISGLSFILKSNPQFIALSKQLFIRYNVFSSVPIEYQMMMCVISTSYLCIQKNKGKASINSYLDETMV